MLVGVGGSGKSSLTRFATHIGGFKIFSVELTRGYGSNEFREDLKKLYRIAGIDGTSIVFLFSDTQIVTESFLEDINNMLNSGEVGLSMRVQTTTNVQSLCTCCVHIIGQGVCGECGQDLLFAMRWCAWTEEKQRSMLGPWVRMLGDAQGT